MRILLTGGSGMVGHNFLEHADARQFEIYAPSSKELNLINFSSVVKYIEDICPDMIIHAAGLVGGIQANMREPVRFLIENLDMGRNIVYGARTAGVRKLINLGSSCMYPRNGKNPLSEEQVLQGELEPTNEGYALAKVMTSRLCEYITREDSAFQYKTLVPCNLYGRWDKFDPRHSHLIPAVIHKIHNAKRAGEAEVEIWGDGYARREFMYAADFADCLVKAINFFDSMPLVMNVGLGHDYTINDYYYMIAEVVGYSGAFKHDLSKPTGMQQKLVDISRLKQWGWDAKTSLRDGIQKTYDFYMQLQFAGRE